MPTFNGRVEAMCTVPSGGASVTASTGALTNAVTVTVPAGQYYPTAAGGVSSLLGTLQDKLNENVQGYPDNAASMTAAVGWGTWSAGWLFNIPSGNDSGAFGGVTMTASGTPTYGHAGPRAGIDKAIGFDSASDLFSAGDVYDATATDDLVIAWVGYVSANPAGSRGWMSKGITPGWYVFRRSNGTLAFVVNDTVDNSTSTAVPVGEWHVGIGVVNRATNRSRVGVIGITSGTVAISAEQDISAQGTLANASSLIVGDAVVTVDTDLKLSAFYIGAGVGVGNGLSSNLSSALANFRAAIGSSFAVALSTTDARISITNSFWPSYVQFNDTNLRSLLGYAYNFDYPQTAAQVTAALGGYGTFTSGAGYLCNEASGNLAAVFGSPATLTAGGSPTYSNVGARGGGDKAVGFDSSTDQFDGGDLFDVAASDDLVIAWVGRWSALPSTVEMMFVKGITGSARWTIYENSGAGLVFGCTSATGTISCTQSISSIVGEWHVGIAVVDRSTGKMRIGVRGLTAGTALVANEATPYAETMANADSFTFGNRNSSLPALQWRCAALYIATGPSVATGLSANLSTALSSFAAYMKGQTATNSARGVWLPDCPIALDGDPDQAPAVSDLRQTESPTGVVLGLAGNYKYRHRNVTWSAVPRAQTWGSVATYSNNSYEQFTKDALMGSGHAWFTPSSRVQVYWDRAGSQVTLGNAANLSGWYVKGISSVEPTMSRPPWNGLWVVAWPELVSNG